MIGRGSPYFLTVGPGWPSYQGVDSPSCGLKPTLMNLMELVDPHQGASGGWQVVLSLMTGHTAWAQE